MMQQAINLASMKFGPSIKTTFIAANNERIEGNYIFAKGPTVTVNDTTNEYTMSQGAWSLVFDEPAQISFARGVYYFTKATVLKKDTSFEMFITLLLRRDLGKERLVTTINEL